MCIKKDENTRNICSKNTLLLYLKQNVMLKEFIFNGFHFSVYSLNPVLQSNANGERLKDVISDHGVVHKAVDYILHHAPEIKTLLS